MIRDLSLTLQAVLDDAALSTDFPELFAAQIGFERPSDSFSPGSTTVDLFLFDIRENTELRNSEPTATRVGGEVLLTPPPLRVACSYLVTAWPTGAGDLALAEHRLLSQTLQVLSKYRHIPAPYLRGQLVGQEPPLPMMTAHANGVREPHEFWAAIGNKMRPSFVVTVTIGMQILPVITAQEVIASRISLDQVPPGTPAAARFRFGGVVRSASNSAPVVDADVKLVEVGLAARTDGDGRYQIGAVVAGTYTLQVTKGGQSQTVSVTLPPAAAGAYDVSL